MGDQPTFGDFVLGLEGLAILRSWMTDPQMVKARVEEISEMVVRLGEQPWSKPIVGWIERLWPDTGSRPPHTTTGQIH